MNEAVEKCVNECELSLEQTLTMATLTPARLMGVDQQIGKIMAGYRADLIALNLKRLLVQNYLEHYVAALDMVYFAGAKTIVVNPESLFVYLSPAIREDYGLDGADYRNASYVDLPPIRQIAPSCVAEDSECLITLKVQQYISSQNHQGEIQLFLKQKPSY